MGTFFFLKDKLEPTLVTHYVKLQGCRPPAEKVSALDGLATHATCPGTGKTEGGDLIGIREAMGLGAAPCEQGEPEHQEPHIHTHTQVCAHMQARVEQCLGPCSNLLHNDCCFSLPNLVQISLMANSKLKLLKGREF